MRADYRGVAAAARARGAVHAAAAIMTAIYDLFDPDRS